MGGLGVEGEGGRGKRARFSVMGDGRRMDLGLAQGVVAKLPSARQRGGPDACP